MSDPNPDYVDAPYEAVGWKVVDDQIVRFITKEISRDDHSIQVEARNIDTGELIETYLISTRRFNAMKP